MDVAAERAALDAIYGSTSGDLTVELWVGHEDAGGVEVSGGGYSAGTLASDGWDAADSEGVKSASSAVDCGTPTEEWSGTVTHYRLVDSDGVSWGCFPLGDPLDVGGAGSAVLVLPRVFFGDSDQN